MLIHIVLRYNVDDLFIVKKENLSTYKLEKN
jgi:hypothetical protein